MLIFPQVLKAGFVLGGSGGNGVLLVRDAKTGGWVGPAFYTMGSASLGFQAGASSAEVVMIINSQKALDSLYSNKVKLGGDASVGDRPQGRRAPASRSTPTSSSTRRSRARSPAWRSTARCSTCASALNTGYYGTKVTPVEILVKQEQQAGSRQRCSGGEEGRDVSEGSGASALRAAVAASAGRRVRADQLPLAGRLLAEPVDALRLVARRRR